MAVAERGEYRRVTVFAPEDADLKVPLAPGGSHRDRPVEAYRARRDYSIHDPEGGVTYHASYSKLPFMEDDNYVNPRHRHAFEQIRFKVHGAGPKYGRTVIDAGWLGYFPEGVYYGPTEPVKPEDKDEWSEHITIQFPGPSGSPFHSRAQTRQGTQRVREAGGTFKDGICIWPDGKKQDAHEAVMEALYGKKMEFPPPVFTEQVWFNTNNVPWCPSPIPGVSIKSLGCFHQRGPAIQLIRLDPGASTQPGKTGAFMIRYVYEGEVEYGGKLCQAVTNMYYPPDAPYEGLTTRTGATILSIELQAQLSGSQPPLPFRI
jgi:hypothetical protein